MTETIDTTHWSFDAFEAAGYPRETLFDPGQVTREDFEENDWRVLELKAHGIEMFDVSEEDLDTEDWAPGEGTIVEYGDRRTKRPIGFADDTGLLNSPERMPSRETFDADSDPTIAFLWPQGGERSFPDYSEAEAVEALGFWGSEGWMPRGTAEAIADAFGVELGESLFTDGPDVGGEEIVRAPNVVQKATSAALERPKGADSNITGHKKRRRQTFYRNLDALREHFGLADE